MHSPAPQIHTAPPTPHPPRDVHRRPSETRTTHEIMQFKRRQPAASAQWPPPSHQLLPVKSVATSVCVCVCVTALHVTPDRKHERLITTLHVTPGRTQERIAAAVSVTVDKKQARLNATVSVTGE
jgi:hypothetical protein